MTVWLCSLTFVSLAAEDPDATDVKLGAESIVHFATLGEARAALTADDAFTRSLSKFDLQSRRKAAGAVTLDDWKKFVVQHVRAWQPEEIAAVTESFQRLSRPLGQLQLPLPKTILMIRTTGEEESDAAYTRGT